MRNSCTHDCESNVRLSSHTGILLSLEKRLHCMYCIVFSKHCFDRNHHIERFSPFLVNIYKQNTESLLAQININYIDIINYFVITNCKPENDPISFIILHTSYVKTNQ